VFLCRHPVGCDAYISQGIPSSFHKNNNKTVEINIGVKNMENKNTVQKNEKKFQKEKFLQAVV
jgi:hypothetical protein